jgi:hypothetical protein
VKWSEVECSIYLQLCMSVTVHNAAVLFAHLPFNCLFYVIRPLTCFNPFYLLLFFYFYCFICLACYRVCSMICIVFLSFFCTSVRAQTDGNPIAVNKYRIVFNVDTSYLNFALPSHTTCKALRKNWNFTNLPRFSCCMYSAQCKNQLIKNNLTCTRIYTQQMKKIIYYSINILQMVVKFGVYTC